MGVWAEKLPLEKVVHKSRWVVRGKLIGLLEEEFPRVPEGTAKEKVRAVGTFVAEIRVVKVLQVLKGELSAELCEALEVYPSNVAAKTKLAKLYTRRIRPSYCAYVYQKVDPTDVDDEDEAIYMITYDTNLHIHHLVCTGSIENVKHTQTVSDIISYLGDGLTLEEIHALIH